MVQRIQLLASSIVPNVQWYYDEIHFSIYILTLTITELQRFHYPKKSGLCNQTLFPWGWGLGTRLIFTLEPHRHVKSYWQCVLRMCMKLTTH